MVFGEINFDHQPTNKTTLTRLLDRRLSPDLHPNNQPPALINPLPYLNLKPPVPRHPQPPLNPSKIHLNLQHLLLPQTPPLNLQNLTDPHLPVPTHPKILTLWCGPATHRQTKTPLRLRHDQKRLKENPI